MTLESSILSFPDRGPWGQASYRGNCSGRIYKGLLETLRPSVFVDLMVGGGTSLDVARDMCIEAYGLDLHSGFNILKQRILDAVGKPADLVLSHLPYHDIIVYSGEIWGQEPHPDDLSCCTSDDDFRDKLTVALKNQRHATRPGGYLRRDHRRRAPEGGLFQLSGGLDHPAAQGRAQGGTDQGAAQRHQQCHSLPAQPAAHHA